MNTLYVIRLLEVKNHRAESYTTQKIIEIGNWII